MVAKLDKNIDFDIKLNTLFENKDFLVINKPAGLVVHPIKSLDEKTLVSYLLKAYPQIKNIGDPTSNGLRPGIVHRLDKDVSGLMIITKTQAAFNYFKKQFQNHQITKEYLALVYGRVKDNQGIITLPLVKGKNGKTIIAKCVDLEKIKETWTEYEVIGRFAPTPTNADGMQTDAEKTPRKSAGEFTLLKVKIKTGRTHQIRIHLKSIGHPIVGDQEYTTKKIIRQRRTSLGLERQKKVDLGRIFLHSFHLAFKDPDGQPQDFKIELPVELQDFLKMLV